MIYDGSLAAKTIFYISNGFWCVAIGVLIIVWLFIGIRNLAKVNTVAMLALFVLSIVLSLIIFGKGTAQSMGGQGITFGAAVEMSVAMPISWLPLISDYTREAEKPMKATAVSAIIYGLVSCWMYIIGMGAAMFTAESDIAQIMVKSGLGIAGLVIIVFSTVTTTFLDAYSAGVSAESVNKGVHAKGFAVVVTLIGTMGAIFFPITDITDFLYFIGSIFAPMIAIQIADFYLLKRSTEHKPYNIKNIVIWFIGFVMYRLLMHIDVIVGCTLVDVFLTIIICIVATLIGGKEKK
jgi:putative hydroxymethylpyrimidine transporter CytX